MCIYTESIIYTYYFLTQVDWLPCIKISSTAAVARLGRSFISNAEVVKIGSDSSTAKHSAIGVNATGPRRR